MTNANATAVELRGVIRGRTIELEAETGRPDGAAVTVRLMDRKPELTDEEKRERLMRSFGAWAGDDEKGLDEYLRWNREQRKIDRPAIEP